MRSDVKGAWIEVAAADGSSVAAYLATPGNGSGPGLVLCHDVFGVDDAMRRIADLFAEEGYVVVVPDLAWRLQPRIDLGPGDAARAGDIDSGLDPALAMADVASTIEALRRLSQCKGKTGALGYGPGGRLALMAAATGAVDCAVSYDGTGIDRVVDAMSTAPAVLLHTAGADPTAAASAVDAVRRRLGADAEVYVYPGVAPGFAVAGRAAYDKQGADMAHTRTIALLRRVLGPRYDLSALWEAHRACEFISRDVDATMRTMVAEPYVNHVPTLTGGYGQANLRRFYKDHFIPKSPKDTRTIPISRTVGADRVVNEALLCFTHDCEIDWLLPGVPPTGKYVEVALVGIITFRGDKLVHEHIYWDQASVLVQVGLLDPAGLPVAGVDAAKKVLDPSLPSNALMKNWADGADDRAT
jgi:carboxymethylenebutenolidase